MPASSPRRLPPTEDSNRSVVRASGPRQPETVAGRTCRLSENLLANAPLHAALGISHITFINTAADYYKHRVEWKEEDWAGPTLKNKTIASAVALGLGRKGYHNMEHALRELQIYPGNMAPLGSIVGKWRESLADHLRSEGAKHGVDIHPRFPEELDTGEPPANPPTLFDDAPPF